VHSKTNEVLVADGYGNRRVIVLDADSGAYKRQLRRLRQQPDDAASTARQQTGPGPQQFNTPHGITVSNDGVVYVGGSRQQPGAVVQLDGTFLKEGFVKRESRGTGTAFGCRAVGGSRAALPLRRRRLERSGSRSSTRVAGRSSAHRRARPQSR